MTDKGGLVCPRCHAASTTVTDSRVRKTIPHAVRRRRQCLTCGVRFSTIETIVPEHLTTEEWARITEFTEEQMEQLEYFIRQILDLPIFTEFHRREQ